MQLKPLTVAVIYIIYAVIALKDKTITILEVLIAYEIFQIVM